MGGDPVEKIWWRRSGQEQAGEWPHMEEKRWRCERDGRS
jgi:hypothetical protein